MRAKFAYAKTGKTGAEKCGQAWLLARLPAEAQRRTKAHSIAHYEKKNTTKDEAIVEAYAIGAYSYQALAAYFGLHFTTAGRKSGNALKT